MSEQTWWETSPDTDMLEPFEARLVPVKVQGLV